MIDPYDDALLYDLEYADHVEDVAFYVDRARNAAGRVLELGCGTGRLTVPIARAGVDVVGVDRSPAMLGALDGRVAREAPAVSARVRRLCADYTTVDPGAIAGMAASGGAGRFRTVIWPFNALHHCQDEASVDAMLARIGGWLDGGGRVALDCYLPDRELYDRDPEGQFEHRTFTHPVTGVSLDSWEQGWWDEAAKVHHVVYVYRWPDGTERRTHLELRMFELVELYRMFDRAGWRIVREASDFSGRPVVTGALKWVGVLARSGDP